MNHLRDLESEAPMRAHSPPGRRDDRTPVALGVVALLACCGVKVLLVVAVALSAGSVGVAGRNLVLGVVGAAAAISLTVFALRRRRRCEQACDVPPSTRAAALPQQQEQVNT